MDFQNKIVWITGASSGIGEALSYQLAARGAHLLLSARDVDRLEAVRAACAGAERHTVLPLDLTDTGSLEAAARTALQRYGPLDVLLHNGGISQRSLAEETSVAVVRRIMEVNFFGAVTLTRAVLPAMLARGTGHFVVVSSLAGKFGTPRRSAYSASKHALHGYFDALRAETAERGLRVTIACPGYVRTRISYHALTADGTPQGSMDRAQAHGIPADACARRIVRAVEREQAEVYIGGKERLGVYLKRFVPGLFNQIIRRVRVT